MSDDSDIPNAVCLPRIPDADLPGWAVGHLQSYVDIMDAAYAGEETDQWWKDRPEVIQIIAQLQEPISREERIQPYDGAAQAAQIIHSMLRQHGTAGSVWYTPRYSRFRLAGADYERKPGEVCVGVYTPDVTLTSLIEDFEFVLRAASQGDPQKKIKPRRHRQLRQGYTLRGHQYLRCLADAGGRAENKPFGVAASRCRMNGWSNFTSSSRFDCITESGRAKLEEWDRDHPLSHRVNATD